MVGGMWRVRLGLPPGAVPRPPAPPTPPLPAQGRLHILFTPQILASLPDPYGGPQTLGTSQKEKNQDWGTLNLLHKQPTGT